MRRFGLWVFLALQFLAPGCSSSPTNLTPEAIPSSKTSAMPTLKPTPRPTTTPTATPNPDSDYKVLYDFKSSEYAIGGVTALNGSLYGSFGTGYRPPVNPDFTAGSGGVYELNLSGAERVLNEDGAPYGGLIAVNGLLYGTGSDSAAGQGVFSLTTSGKRTNFFALSVPDGPPIGNLIDVDGELYGTVVGFASDCFCDNWGGEYAVSLSGTASTLYVFSGEAPGALDGEYPASGLVYSGGKFYGTTSCYDEYFGAFYCPGTVFSLSREGKLTTLHRFKGGSDGIHPFAPLVYLQGFLYGTTARGGRDDGTVFAISPSGSEHVVYRFKNTPDGSEPIGNLTVVGDSLYGTTMYGGANGRGTIFKVTTTGTEEVVHSFRQADGIQPNRDNFDGRLIYGGGLLYYHGMLYGTTTAGGANGRGTVFERKP